MTEDFATALESFEQEQSELAANEDRVLKGTVISINPNYLVVDIGLKSEGVVPLAEVQDHEGNVKFQPGNEIDVMIEKGHTEEGYVNLSHQKAQRLHAWDEIEKAYNDKSSIKVRVIDRIKGGLTVDVMGARAFLPGSQVDTRPIRNLDSLKGQDIEVRVIKLNKKRGNIVVSRKQMLEEELTSKRDKTMEQLAEGAVLTGTVKNLTDYGAFVDLGGIDGLLHITDMSWGRLTHPHDLVQVGDQIQVKVLKFDKDKQRVSLGFKQLTPDPWLDAAERYPIGRARAGPGDQRDRLRRFRRARAGHRGAGACQRDDLVEADEASLEDRQRRRPRRGRGAERERAGAAHFARPEAIGIESLGVAAREISGGLDCRGQGSQPHRLRRVSSRSKTESTVWCTSAI